MVLIEIGKNKGRFHATSLPFKATVELGGHFARGLMVLDRRRSVICADGFKPNIITVDQVDVKRFQSRYLKALGHIF